MAYSTDAREMALNYHRNGHTLEETSKELKVGMATLTSITVVIMEKLCYH